MPRQNEAAEARPSRLILQRAGPPQELPPELHASARPAPLSVSFEDFSRIPFPPGKVAGGAAVLTAQSQCPFKPSPQRGWPRSIGSPLGPD